MPLRIISTKALQAKEYSIARLQADCSNVKSILNELTNSNFDAAMKVISKLESNDERQSWLDICTKLQGNEEHLRKTEWISSGLLQINQRFTYSKKPLEQRLDETLSALVKYTGANQGAIFLLDEEGRSLVMNACYAYDKKKFINKSLDVSEGLVGQCFLEQSPIILNEVPGNYIRITSGLGEALPRFVRLFPMSAKEARLGVVELAFFAKPADHINEFMQGLCERLSYSIAEIIKSDRNEKLLLESKSLSEKLIVKEKMLEQMIEEMSAIQEELERKNNFLEQSRQQIEKQQQELLRLQQEDNELMESKLHTQQMIHDTIAESLRSKVLRLEMALKQKLAVAS